MTALATLERPRPTRSRADAGRRGRAYATATAVAPRWEPVRAPAPRRVPLRVVTRPERRALRRRRTLISAWATAFALLTIVAFHVVLAQSQITLDRLEQRTKAAEQAYEEARFEHAQLANPSRIMQRAAQLGLMAPDRPPTVVPVQGEVPPPPDAPTTTLNGWTNVKPTLNSSP